MHMEMPIAKSGHVYWQGGRSPTLGGLEFRTGSVTITGRVKVLRNSAPYWVTNVFYEIDTRL